MNPILSKKKFDCLQSKREVQAQIYAEIKDMSPEQEREYFRQRAESGRLGAWWKAVKRRSGT